MDVDGCVGWRYSCFLIGRVSVAFSPINWSLEFHTDPCCSFYLAVGPIDFMVSR